MLSIPHMIVVFLVVLVVFGPEKLPELARSVGKLMAEFRKASGDFKSAFEDEMRDLERQARLAELRKQAAEAATPSSDGAQNALPSTVGSPAGTEPCPEIADDTRLTEAPVITPVAETVPRSDAGATETASADGASPTESSPSHDQQQPA